MELQAHYLPCEKIVKSLNENGQLNISQLAKETNLSRDLVKYRIACLEQRGIVVTYKIENRRVCTLTGHITNECYLGLDVSNEVRPVTTTSLVIIDRAKRLFARNRVVRAWGELFG